MKFNVLAFGEKTKKVDNLINMAQQLKGDHIDSIAKMRSQNKTLEASIASLSSN